MKYKWTVEGTAGHGAANDAEGQTWQTTGEMDIDSGNFLLALSAVMRLSFQQLTQGLAVYGKPGVGCRGPYHITRYVLEAI